MDDGNFFAFHAKDEVRSSIIKTYDDSTYLAEFNLLYYYYLCLLMLFTPLTLDLKENCLDGFM